MQTPDPLPQPGAWLVINDDELYEVVAADEDGNPCPVTADGVYYLSVNDGEAIWTPWDDDSVTAVFPTLAEAEAYTDAEVTDVFTVTIRHRRGHTVTPGMVADELYGGLENNHGMKAATVRAERADPDPEDGGEGCQQPSRPDGHHRISDSLCADCLEFV